MNKTSGGDTGLWAEIPHLSLSLGLASKTDDKIFLGPSTMLSSLSVTQQILIYMVDT